MRSFLLCRCCLLAVSSCFSLTTSLVLHMYDTNVSIVIFYDPNKTGLILFFRNVNTDPAWTLGPHIFFFFF